MIFNVKSAKIIDFFTKNQITMLAEIIICWIKKIHKKYYFHTFYKKKHKNLKIHLKAYYHRKILLKSAWNAIFHVKIQRYKPEMFGLSHMETDSSKIFIGLISAIISSSIVKVFLEFNHGIKCHKAKLIFLDYKI